MGNAPTILNNFFINSPFENKLFHKRKPCLKFMLCISLNRKFDSLYYPFMKWIQIQCGLVRVILKLRKFSYLTILCEIFYQLKFHFWIWKLMGSSIYFPVVNFLAILSRKCVIIIAALLCGIFFMVQHLLFYNCIVNTYT